MAKRKTVRVDANTIQLVRKDTGLYTAMTVRGEFTVYLLEGMSRYGRDGRRRWEDRGWAIARPGENHPAVKGCANLREAREQVALLANQ
jgi:hypothetical protein